MLFDATCVQLQHINLLSLYLLLIHHQVRMAKPAAFLMLTSEETQIPIGLIALIESIPMMKPG